MTPWIICALIYSIILFVVAASSAQIVSDSWAKAAQAASTTWKPVKIRIKNPTPTDNHQNFMKQFWIGFASTLLVLLGLLAMIFS